MLVATGLQATACIRELLPTLEPKQPQMGQEERGISVSSAIRTVKGGASVARVTSRCPTTLSLI